MKIKMTNQYTDVEKQARIRTTSGSDMPLTEVQPGCRCRFILDTHVQGHDNTEQARIIPYQGETRTIENIAWISDASGNQVTFKRKPNHDKPYQTSLLFLADVCQVDR